jgi:hypothetical protein
MPPQTAQPPLKLGDGKDNLGLDTFFLIKSRAEEANMTNRKSISVLFMLAVGLCLNLLSASATQGMVGVALGAGWEWWVGGVVLNVALAATGVGAVGAIVATSYFSA